MARTTRYSNETILDAARELFFEKGPSASTSEIAKAAGVSEGLLFKRFGTKQTLFLAAMGLREPNVEQTLRTRIGRGDVRDNLIAAVTDIISFLSDLFPRVMMVWSHHKTAMMEEIHSHPDVPAVLYLRAIANYIEQENDRGRMHCTDPIIAARTIIGAAMHYVFWELTGLNRHVPTNAAEFAERVIDVLLDGLKNTSSSAPDHERGKPS